MKSFDIPPSYRSNLITEIKNRRKQADKLKKDFSPTELNLGGITFLLARHFGFCYGVENAIEIAFKTVEENPGKNIYLLSEMIHNPQVNDDLKKNGVSFILDTLGNHYIPWEEIQKDDIVIIPAFGTTVETRHLLEKKGINTQEYNTTCPFVEKVWNRGEQIGKKGYTIIIHGKPNHEETRATFSQSAQSAPCLVINDIGEARSLSNYMRKQKNKAEFENEFSGRFSIGFDPEKHLGKIGVINQTTMLAEDTQAIADYLKAEIIDIKKPESELMTKDFFADTRDTLCYATNDNQSAVKGLLESEADLALVVGGYNSSNTSHLVELCETKLPTFFIKDDQEIISENEIQHFDFHSKQRLHSKKFLPMKDNLRILITAGASCPDSMVEAVMKRIASIKGVTFKEDEILQTLI